MQSLVFPTLHNQKLSKKSYRRKTSGGRLDPHLVKKELMYDAQNVEFKFSRLRRHLENGIVISTLQINHFTFVQRIHTLKQEAR